MRYMDGLKKAKHILDQIKGEVVVGVSGGADSMCLLNLILKSRISLNRVYVVHIDHRLRQESKHERQFVEDFCRKNGVEIEVFEGDILSLAKKSGRSVETEARVFRHDVFNRVCARRGAVLLLAHTSSDQAETVLMHIFRGCGVAGLIGMSERDENIIRPLIYSSRSEVEDFCAENNIEFCVDFSNFDLKYDRNFVRDLIKRVQARYKNAAEHINNLSRFAKELIDSSTIMPDFISRENGVVLLNKTALTEPNKTAYVIAAAKCAGLKTDLESKHVFAILGLSEKETGCKINLPHGIVCANERKNLAFFVKTDTDIAAELDFKLGENRIGDVCVSAVECDTKVLLGQIIVDANKLNGAVIRFRRDGDTFTPCNGKRKKLKEFFNSKKVENRLKDFVPLICRGNEVLVVCGMELSDLVKLTPATKRAFKIDVKPLAKK